MAGCRLAWTCDYVCEHMAVRSALTGVAQAERIARKKLPAPVYEFIRGGNEANVTVRANVKAFEEIGLRPRVATTRDERQLRTTVLGTSFSMPIMPTPAGFIRIAHPDAEAGVARAAQRAGVPIGLSILSSIAMEEICALNDNVWLQLYLIGGLSGTKEVIDRARAAGVRALIVTVDLASGTGGNDRGKPMPPPSVITPGTALRFAPHLARHPRWAWQFARGGLALHVPNVPGPDGRIMTVADGSRALREYPPTWDDIRFIRKQWSGPLIVKGIVTPEDARIAADIGVDGLSVSNHGGNGLDGGPATITALPAIADAVGDRVAVLMDGGVRRGSDVVKALALGARAVLIGRAYIWALAAAGEQGVDDILAAFRKGIAGTLSLLDVPGVHDLAGRDILQRNTTT